MALHTARLLLPLALCSAYELGWTSDWGWGWSWMGWDKGWGVGWGAPRFGFFDAPQTFSVRFLHMNDHHSHVAEASLTLQAEDSGEEVSLKYGGFPRLISLFKKIEAASAEPVVKLHAGDAITGTLWYSLFHGQVDAALMNMICFDAFVLGNHEFDDGDGSLATFLQYLRTEGNCSTPVLAANVVPSASSPLGAGFSDYLLPFTVVDAAGEKIGIIGLDIKAKTEASSSPDEGTVLLDELSTARRYVQLLRAAGVTKIVLLTHRGYSLDVAMAAELDGVDVIVGGDSHSLLGPRELSALGLSSVGEYPTIVTRRDGSKVCVVTAWEYAHLVGNLLVTFDEEGRVLECTGTPVLPVASDPTADITSRTPMRQAVDPDPVAAEYIRNKSVHVEALKRAVVATFEQPACLERFPGEGKSGTVACTNASYARGGEVCNLVAQAFLWRERDADIAIQNAGGCRTTVPAGPHSISNAYALLPFSNNLVASSMLGAQIIQVLEDALAGPLDLGGSTGSYPYAAGLRFEVDASAPAGRRIRNAQVQQRAASSRVWQPMNLSGTYRVVTQDYISAGKDNYLEFDKLSWTKLHHEYAQTWLDWLELGVKGVVKPLAASDYSTQKYVDPSGCDHSIAPYPKCL
ncbi:hypothetical protein AB1Y20_008256 [Prymnesium parvum]|uniref:5'-nucleotidase n=1 Tax=Prymnesium parvum TaxID=97485 RepID=A0AB34IWM6_PRYPA